MYRRIRERVAITLQYDMRQLVMRILIIADPLNTLRHATDTSVCLAVECRQRGYAVWWSSGGAVSLCDQTPLVHAAPITAAAVRGRPSVGSFSNCELFSFDAILIRKDPPFNEDYIRMCWLLAPYEHKMNMSNRPSLLVQHHEKMIPLQAMVAGFLRPQEIIPSVISPDLMVVEVFCAKHAAGSWILKPWTGFGGHGVRKVESIPAVLDAVRASSQPLIVQPFLPVITTAGDRRVFYVGGEMVGDYVRLPQAGGFISNLASGGRAELRPMDVPTRDRAERLGRFLRTAGFDFAGADFIDEYVSEVNVTSPTGVVSLMNLGGPDLTPRIVDQILSRKS